MKRELRAVRKEYTDKHYVLQNENTSLREHLKATRIKHQTAEAKLEILIAENIELKKQIEILSPKTIERSSSRFKRKSKRREDKIDIYEVQSILDHKITKKQRKYLVRWKGYDSDHDSWEDEANLNCPRILKPYLKSQNIA